MIVQLESMSRNVNLYGRLSTLALSGADDLLRRQLDYARLLVEQGASQWRRMSAQASGAQTPEQWSQLVQDGVEGAVEAMRDCMAAASEHHAETLRTMQQNFAKTQEAFAAALDGWTAACAADAGVQGRGRTRPEKRAA